MSTSGNTFQFELFNEDINITRLEEHDLASMFVQLNQRYWKGLLPSFRCEWSNRMITTWGACYRKKGLIRISGIFKQRPREEILALLCHEMIHIRYAGHGKRFRQELKRIGLEGDIQGRFPGLVQWTESLRRAYRYTYRCKRCGVEIRRRRKIHGYCVACHARGIRSKFKLVQPAVRPHSL